MNLVDSCGWLEYLADGPHADFYAPAIEDAASLLVPSICILEVFRKVLSEKGEGAALTVAAHMRQGNVVSLDTAIAVRAATLGHSLKLPLADSVILATARQHGATVWTQDGHFRGIADVKYLDPKSPIADH